MKKMKMTWKKICQPFPFSKKTTFTKRVNTLKSLLQNSKMLEETSHVLSFVTLTERWMKMSFLKMTLMTSTHTSKHF
jgi:hypothetical protein